MEFVTNFDYLGVQFQASGLAFSKRDKAAIFATSKLNSLPKASLDTALKLFDLPVSPIASYGIEAIWNFLSENDFHQLKTDKSRILKRVLCLSKHTNSRYCLKADGQNKITIQIQRLLFLNFMAWEHCPSALHKRLINFTLQLNLSW